MKLTKSKQFLADAIHASGRGWPDGASWAAQDKTDGQCNDNMMCFFSGEKKPVCIGAPKMWRCGGPDSTFIGYSHSVKCNKLSPNWHQTVLSREEYFSAYPAEPVAVLKQDPVADADGWIEWEGGKCPVDYDVDVDTKHREGRTDICRKAGGAWWNHAGIGEDIISYRLHKPDVNPEFCESVTRSIPWPATKPSIEQLAADYRNKPDYANRKQQEADDAKSAADAALGELIVAGKTIDLVIGIAKPEPEPELVITDLRDLRVGDDVECIKDNIGNKYSGVIGVVQKIDYDDTSTPVCVDIDEVGGIWCHEVKFIRRP